MKTFKPLLVIIHLLACVCAFAMCIEEYHWYLLVIGLYALGAMSNELIDLTTDD